MKTGLLCLLALIAGAQPASPDVLIRLSAEEIAYDAVEVAGELWVAMASGLYLVEGLTLTQASQIASPRVLASIDDELWVGTKNRVWRQQGGEWVDVFDGPTPEVTVIEEFEGEVWIGTLRGMVGAIGQQMVLSEPINDIKIIGDRLWVVGSRNLYYLEGEGEFVGVFGEPRNAHRLWPVGSTLWLTMIRDFGLPGSPIRLSRSLEVQEVPALSGYGVTSVVEVEGEPWFATTEGILQSSGGAEREEYELIPLPSPVNVIHPRDEGHWIGTTRGPYCFGCQGGIETEPLLRFSAVNVKSFVEAEDRSLWMLTREGIFLQMEVSLRAELNTLSLAGREILWGHRLRLSSLAYQNADGELFSSIRVDETESSWAFERDPKELMSESALLPLKEDKYLEFGATGGYLLAVDAFGNSVLSGKKGISAFPGPGPLLGFSLVGIVVWISWLMVRRMTTDSLTGLRDRRRVGQKVEGRVNRWEGEKRHFSLMRIDVDRFKRVNDDISYKAGDALLRRLGQILNKSFRGSDKAYRWGGDEFLVVLPKEDLDAAVKRAESLRQTVEKERVVVAGEELPTVTISIGVASFPEHGERALDIADKAVHRAKKHRNRVEAGPSEHADGGRYARRGHRDGTEP